MLSFKDFIRESVASNISSTPTRFVTIEEIPKEMVSYAQDPRYIIMNAPRPILGEYETQGGSGIHGNHFAAVKVNGGEDAEFQVKQNNKAKAVILYPVSQGDLESIAVGDSKYREKILSGDVRNSIEMAVQKMKDVSYREALSLVKKYAEDNLYP